MSGKAMEWAIEQGTKSSSAKLVLLVLAHHKNHESGQCNPGVSRIADFSGYSERKVQQALRELEDLSLIAIIRKSGSKNSYELKTPADFTGAQDLQGAESTGHPRSDCGTPPQDMRDTPAEKRSPFSIEQGKEQDKKNKGKRAPKKSTPKKPWAEFDLSDWPGVPSDEVMAQWWKVRKAKRCVATQLAMDGVAEELQKAAAHGYQPEQCITLAVRKSWGGFEFEWLLNHINRQQGGGFREPGRGEVQDTLDWGEGDGGHRGGQNSHQQANGPVAGHIPRMGGGD